MKKHLLEQMKLVGQYAELANKALDTVKVSSVKRALSDQRSDIVLQGYLPEPAGPLD